MIGRWETPLIGRRRELSRMVDALGAVAAGSSTILEVRGEPGIGKTRLISELLELARSRDFLVIVGRGAELEEGVPFGPFLDALDGPIRALGAELIEQMSSEEIQELAGVFPSVSPAGGGPVAEHHAERYRFYRAVRVLLANMAQRRQLVLALDDAHWADPASIELISHLLRHRVEGPMLLLVAYRPHQAAAALTSTFETAARDLDVERVELGPLDPDEADQLLGGELDARAKGRCYHESGGNPFYLEQLARASAHGREEPAGGWQGDGRERFPHAVSSALEDEVAAQAPRSRRLLRGAAVLGEPFEPDLAAKTAEMELDEGLAALDELIDADLVRSTDLPRRFRFRHPIVRSAVYETTKPGWRLAAHARAAEALAEAGQPATVRAHHLERSSAQGDEGAIDILIEAATDASARAPGVAADRYRGALGLLPETCDPARRLELLVPMAIALGSSGRLEESRATLQEVLGLVPDGISEIRLEAVAFAAVTEILLGNNHYAREMLLRELRSLPDHSVPADTLLKCHLAWTCFLDADFEGMLRWAESACEGRVVESGVDAVASAAFALAHYLTGDYRASRSEMRVAAAVIDGLTDDQLAGSLEAFTWVGLTEAFQGELALACEHLDRGIALSRSTGQAHRLAPMLVGQAYATCARGRLEEAAELAEGGTECALLSGHKLDIMWAFVVRSIVQSELGDSAEAFRSAEKAYEHSAAAAKPIAAFAANALAQAALDSGDAERCRELLAPDGPVSEFAAIPNEETRSCELLVLAEIALGDLDAAAVWADRAERKARQMDIPTRRVEADRARANLLLAREQAAAAAALALAAAGLADRCGARLDAARCRLLAAQALAQSGDPKAALRQAELAEREFGACGALRKRDQAAGVSLRLGHGRGSRRSSRNGALGLTPRQREVSEQVALGKTNREIAAQLSLTERAIENHLSRIFSRLGISSRASLAAMVSRTAPGREPGDGSGHDAGGPR